MYLLISSMRPSHTNLSVHLRSLPLTYAQSRLIVPLGELSLVPEDWNVEVAHMMY